MLTFSRKWAPSELRRLETIYVGTNYGFTFLHSLIFLVLDVAKTQAGIYGSANVRNHPASCYSSLIEEALVLGDQRLPMDTIYLWLRHYMVRRLNFVQAFFSKTVKLTKKRVGCFLITIIYLATGIKIIRQNMELKHGNYALDTPVTVLQVGNPFRPAGQPILCVTEVQVTSSLREPISPCSTAAEVDFPTHPATDKPQDEILANRHIPSAGPHGPQPEKSALDLGPCSPTDVPKEQQVRPDAEDKIFDGPVTTTSYQKVEHVPSEVSRTERHQGELQTTVSVPKPKSLFSIRFRLPWNLKKTPKLRDPRAAHARDAAMAYCKMSILMFLSLILVWVSRSTV